MGLVISRRRGQVLRIELGGTLILVKVAEVHRSSVKLHIDAPRGVEVIRGELVELAPLALREDRSIEQQRADGDLEEEGEGS